MGLRFEAMGYWFWILGLGLWIRLPIGFWVMVLSFWVVGY